MAKKLRELIEEAEAFISEYDQVLRKDGTGDKSRLLSLLSYMNRWLLYMQHERLIHLIVTVLFALAMLIVFGVFVLSGAMYILALLALILVLLVPYIVHYFHLENGVQKMYTLIDELEKRKGQ